MRLRTIGMVLVMATTCPALLAEGTTPSSSSLWKSVRQVMHHRLLLPASKRYQPGSRAGDYYTIDGVNPTALAYVHRERGVMHSTRFPVGSLLIKENYDVHHRLVNITAMLKADRFDTGDHNWIMANYSPGGKVLAFGKVAACINCHAIAGKSDFVFAPPPLNLLSAQTIHSFFPGKKITKPYKILLKKYPHAVLQ